MKTIHTIFFCLTLLFAGITLSLFVMLIFDHSFERVLPVLISNCFMAFFNILSTVTRRG